MLNRIRHFLCNLRSQKWQQQEAEKGLDQGYYSLPYPKERAKMSPEKLAILLSEQKPGTPACILVEHELNIRIAQVEARATERASYVGIVGVVVGIFVTALLIPRLQKSPKENPETIQAGSERNANSAAKPRTNVNVSAGNLSVVPSAQPEKQRVQSQQSSPNK
ncbi:MAG: hypothetical protein Q8L39_01755 [Burkholderiales bacterium]|nr:hypothetical protein [Burkholderiales bacterium]